MLFMKLTVPNINIDSSISTVVKKMIHKDLIDLFNNCDFISISIFI